MEEEPTWQPEGVLLRLDPEARSADSSLPAFLARPKDAPVYHGFPCWNSREPMTAGVSEPSRSLTAPRETIGVMPSWSPLTAAVRGSSGRLAELFWKPPAHRRKVAGASFLSGCAESTTKRDWWNNSENGSPSFVGFISCRRESDPCDIVVNCTWNTDSHVCVR